MLAVLLQRIGEGKQRLLRHAVGGQDVGHLRLAAGDRAGLVQRHDFGLAGFLQRDGGLEQDAVPGAQAVADHDRHRRGQPQRARAADDQHGDAAGEGEADALTGQQPDGRRHGGDGNDRGDEHAGDPVGDLGDRSLGRGGVGDHLDDLGERRVLADARRLAAEEAGLVDRRGGHRVARGLVDRDALACQRGFVDRALALEHHAVHWNVFARMHDEDVAQADLLDRHGHLLTVTQKHGGLRCELHQAPERVGRRALGARLEHLAHGDEREDHRGGLKVELVHAAHHARRVTAQLRVRHGEEGIGAVHKRCAGAERHQRVHVRRAVNQPFEAADKELLVDDHHGGGKQQLHQAHSDVIVSHERGKRPAPHHVAHGEVHQHDEEAERRDEPALERGRLVIGKRILAKGGGAAGGTRSALQRCAVAGVLNGLDDRLRARRALHAHGVGQQADRAGRHARHGGNRLFHPGAAGGAAHARDNILFQRNPSLLLKNVSASYGLEHRAAVFTELRR